MIKQVNQGVKNTFNENLNLMTIIKGIIVSYIITIPAFIIFAIILTYVSFPEKLISPAVVIITIISILVAGSTATKSTKSRGWLNGGIVGLIYMLFLYILSSSIINNFAIDRYVATMTVIGVLTGCIGGITGINIKAGTHKRAKLRKA